MVWTVFWKNYRERRVMPSLNMVVPFVALYLWWLPRTRQSEFYLLLTPLFHSLQYLTFVYRMEQRRLETGPRVELRATVLVVALVTAGWLARCARAFKRFGTLPSIVRTRLATCGTSTTR